ncbi:MAG: HAMP domain-containing histidine kinase [Gammaproteobacteria bacterium]|nr:HAMP domain-containing histidine kinase [Gammaproteobacteria bacterium]MCP5196517.1 HAMP domain-containing histidine kinase [Gammaproteobacteria bacterium]
MRIDAITLGSTDLQLNYTDHGVGILKLILHLIFEPFFTAKLSSGGCRLGFYIVYNLVTRILGGTIQGLSRG